MKNKDWKFLRKIKHFRSNNSLSPAKDQLKMLKLIHLKMMIKMSYLKIVQTGVKAHTKMDSKNQKNADFKKVIRN